MSSEIIKDNNPLKIQFGPRSPTPNSPTKDNQTVADSQNISTNNNTSSNNIKKILKISSIPDIIEYDNHDDDIDIDDKHSYNSDLDDSYSSNSPVPSLDLPWNKLNVDSKPLPIPESLSMPALKINYNNNFNYSSDSDLTLANNSPELKNFNKFNKFNYQHEHYIADNSKNELLQFNNDLETDPNIESGIKDFKFLENDSDSNLQRNTSVISISGKDCKLDTKIIGKVVSNNGNGSGNDIQFNNNLIFSKLRNDNNQSNSLSSNSSSRINSSTSSNYSNLNSNSNSNDIPNTSELNNINDEDAEKIEVYDTFNGNSSKSTPSSPKKFNHQHKRSTSLSDFVGGIIKSFSFKNDQIRNVSVATSTLTEDYISAKEEEEIKNDIDENNSFNSQNTVIITSTNENDSSFKSDDFVLEIQPFEDDIYSNEFEEFKKFNKNRISSINSNSSSKRISSLEFTDMNEMLNIWNKQKNFNGPFKKPEFDSINEPIINSPFKQMNMKVKVLNPNMNFNHKKESSIVDRLEVLPYGVRHNSKQLQNDYNENDFNQINDNDHHHHHHHNVDSDHDDNNVLDVSLDSTFQVSMFNETNKMDEDNNDTNLININHDTTTNDPTLLKNIWREDNDDGDNSDSNNDSHNNYNNQMNGENMNDFNNGNNNNELESNGIPKLTHSDTFKRMDKEIQNFLNKNQTLNNDDEYYNLKNAKITSFEYKNPNIINSQEQKASVYQFTNDSRYSQIVPYLDIADNSTNSFLDLDSNDAGNIDNFNNFNNDTVEFTNIMNNEFANPEIDNNNSNNNMNSNSNTNTIINDVNISPARKKMVEKFEQQLKQKEIQKVHKKLQLSLKRKVHNDAIIFNPFREENDQLLNNNHVKRESLQVKLNKNNNDIGVNDHSNHDNSIDEIYEKFDDNLSNNLPKNGLKILTEPIIAKSKKIDNNIEVEDIKDDDLDPFKIDNKIDNKIDESIKQKLINGEQGRMFLKIDNLNDIKLPELKQRNCKVQIILDNGIHCINTNYLPVKDGKIDINKEFELIVADKLNLIITFKLKYDKPIGKTYEVAEKRKVKSKKLMGKIIGKKETKIIKKLVVEPPPIDKLAEYLSTDGSFSKIKINFDDYKEQIFNKVSTYSLICFNEWKNIKSSNGKVINKNSIPICKISLKMLFIKRSIKNEILPISISNTMNQLNQFNDLKLQLKPFEGFMKQEGGDIGNSIIRRFYKLKDDELFAFNENSMKLKAKINLKKMIECKKSDYELLNNGFIIKFSNGEEISFSCDDNISCDEWVSNLSNRVAIASIVAKQPWLTHMNVAHI